MSGAQHHAATIAVVVGGHGEPALTTVIAPSAVEPLNRHATAIAAVTID
jgi:hypothetical protein